MEEGVRLADRDGILPLALLKMAQPLVVDLCSGSGALALAVADEAPTARVYAVERSSAALSYLRRNAAGTRVVVVEGDIADVHLLDTLNAEVDVVNNGSPLELELEITGRWPWQKNRSATDATSD